jgi:hypothetical protein
MPQPETRAWWSDVQHVRDSIERKREDEARRGLRLDARAAAQAVAHRHEPESDGQDALERVDAPAEPHAMDLGDLEWVTRPRRRFDRSPERHGRFVRAERESERGGREPDTAARAPEGAERANPERARRRSKEPRPLDVPGRRRTVEITGRTVPAPTLPRLVKIDRRRPARRPVERVGPRPDRLALWAVVLGFFLILVAVTSTAHAATGAQGARAAGGATVHWQVITPYTATLRATPPAR